MKINWLWLLIAAMVVIVVCLIGDAARGDEPMSHGHHAYRYHMPPYVMPAVPYPTYPAYPVVPVYPTPPGYLPYYYYPSPAYTPGFYLNVPGVRLWIR